MGYPENKTATKTVEAADGTPVTLCVPLDLPSEERAEKLRVLYTQWVTHPDKHWKGRAQARVPAEQADDVADATDFIGSILDERRTLPSGRVLLKSDGYWAHGF